MDSECGPGLADINKKSSSSTLWPYRSIKTALTSLAVQGDITFDHAERRGQYVLGVVKCQVDPCIPTLCCRSADHFAATRHRLWRSQPYATFVTVIPP